MRSDVTWIRLTRVFDQVNRAKEKSLIHWKDSLVGMCVCEGIQLRLADYMQWNVSCLHHLTALCVCDSCESVIASFIRVCERLGRQTDRQQGGETARQQGGEESISNVTTCTSYIAAIRWRRVNDVYSAVNVLVSQIHLNLGLEKASCKSAHDQIEWVFPKMRIFWNSWPATDCNPWIYSYFFLPSAIQGWR